MLVMQPPRTSLTVLAIIATALFGAPVVQADENIYLKKVANTLSVSLTPSQALALGNTACKVVRSAMANGMTLGNARNQADQAVGRAQNEMGLGLSMADGMHLVDAAVDQLC